jgi:alanine dehydrogenase
MVLILSGNDIRRILNVRDTIAVVEEAYREFADGHAQMPPRQLITDPKRNGWIAVMPAYIPKAKALATKVVTVYTRNSARNLPTTMATIILNDSETGRPLAVMDGGYLTAVRTGAVGGVAAKYLSRSDSHTVGIFGAGIQARTQLEALCEVRRIETAVVFDLIPEVAEKYAADMSRLLKIRVDIAKTAEAAVKGSDIIVTASTSETPVFEGRWVDGGTHVTCIGSHMAGTREIDTDVVRRSKVVVDLRAAAESEYGEILIPLQKGEITSDVIYGELGDLVTNRKAGRTNPQEITLFKSGGLAIQDTAAARLAYTKAIESNIGTETDFQ